MLESLSAAMRAFSAEGLQFNLIVALYFGG
jgi:hypothetical protein